MTADQRLDQLEPLLSEAMTVLDRHTVQLKQLNTNQLQLTELLYKQSDNISFLLNESISTNSRLTTLEVSVAGLQTSVTNLEVSVAGLQTSVAKLETNVAGLQTSVASLHQGQADTNTKLDLILSKLL